MSRTLGAFFAALVLPWAISAQPSPVDGTLPCLQPVDGLTWMRWNDNRPTLDLWCSSVGPPIFERRIPKPGVVTGWRILSWNINVGGGHLEDVLPGLLKDARDREMGLIVLLQESFRGGDAVPQTYPATLNAPKAIRPRRPAPDIRAIAERFDLSVAYVPSMRNGPATSLAEREDRGNAILTTEFLLDVKAIELPFGKQRRVAISAAVGSGSQSLRVVTMHFDTNDHRVTQALALGERIAFLIDLPLFVGGDLNARGGLHDGAVLALGSRLSLASCGIGRTNRWPLRLDVLFPMIGRLDYIFTATQIADITRSCETLRDARGSDHLPPLMTLRY
jgi:endonuclease/exonuclease/phosphatase family metal-dependent hydrolase